MIQAPVLILMVIFSLLFWAYAIIGFKEVHFKERYDGLQATSCVYRQGR